MTGHESPSRRLGDSALSPASPQLVLPKPLSSLLCTQPVTWNQTPGRSGPSAPSSSRAGAAVTGPTQLRHRHGEPRPGPWPQNGGVGGRATGRATPPAQLRQRPRPEVCGWHRRPAPGLSEDACFWPHGKDGELPSTPAHGVCPARLLQLPREDPPTPIQRPRCFLGASLKATSSSPAPVPPATRETPFLRVYALLTRDLMLHTDSRPSFVRPHRRLPSE